MEKDDSWKKYAGKTILALNGKVILVSKDPNRIEKRRSSFFEPLLRSQTNIVSIPTEENEKKRRILQILNLLEKTYGAKNIAKVLEEAHKDNLLVFQLPVGLIGKLPTFTKEGKEWVENQKIKE